MVKDERPRIIAWRQEIWRMWLYMHFMIAVTLQWKSNADNDHFGCPQIIVSALTTSTTNQPTATRFRCWFRWLENVRKWAKRIGIRWEILLFGWQHINAHTSTTKCEQEKNKEKFCFQLSVEFLLFVRSFIMLVRIFFFLWWCTLSSARVWVWLFRCSGTFEMSLLLFNDTNNDGSNEDNDAANGCGKVEDTNQPTNQPTDRPTDIDVLACQLPNAK